MRVNFSSSRRVKLYDLLKTVNNEIIDYGQLVSWENLLLHHNYLGRYSFSGWYSGNDGTDRIGRFKNLKGNYISINDAQSIVTPDILTVPKRLTPISPPSNKADIRTYKR